MPQQQEGYNMHPSFGGFINDPTAQLGFQMGKTAMDAGQHYVEQNVRQMPVLARHVSNRLLWTGADMIPLRCRC